MLPTGKPSLTLIWAYGTGGSAVSKASSRWQQGIGGERIALRCVPLGHQQLMLR
jgi:hypothetical protein